MPDLDLDTLAAEVAAVLDRHGVPTKDRRYAADDLANYVKFAHWPPAMIEEGWTLYLYRDTGRVVFNGTMTQTARDALSIVWAHVHGQDGEAGDRKDSAGWERFWREMAAAYEPPDWLRQNRGGEAERDAASERLTAAVEAWLAEPIMSRAETHAARIRAIQDALADVKEHQKR